ncbi:MAG: type II toxin-antitoxin system HicA family toxin [Methylococcus sp.]|nr:type II toxin-antitoxin system HicA family toxin [Methylococcus sp.]
MSKHAKTLAKTRNNPKDWRIDDLLAEASHYGIEVRNDGGSHHVFSHKCAPQPLSVPAHRPIKPIYVRQFIELIDTLEALP